MGDEAGRGSLRGKLLVAAPTLGDPNFFRTVVLLLEHSDDDGAVGVVLNRPSEMALPDRLSTWAAIAAPPAVVFIGGPVEPQNGIGLARTLHSPEVSPVNLHVDPVPNLHLEVRFFAGYAGWSAGQLEAELAEGGWIVVDAASDDALTIDPAGLWTDVLRRQGGALAALVNYPDDLTLN